MPDPGTLVLLVLICWTVGGVFLLAAGITALTTAIRRHRRTQ